MIALNGDKDGFAGTYAAEGNVWTVTKVYVGRGIGARWQVTGPFFGERSFFDFSGIGKIVSNWLAQGAIKTS